MRVRRFEGPGRVASGPPDTDVTEVRAAASLWLTYRPARACQREQPARYRAKGLGRSWKCTTLLVVPFPVSIWKGARVLTVAHSPRPFQPACGSSIRPS